MAMRQWVGVIASLMPLIGCIDAQAGHRSGSALDRVPVSSPRARGDRARTYYVAPTGADANAGTSRAPFRTIQRAADMAQPGDTVLVRPGLYTGASRIVSLDRGGAPSRWITYRSERKWEAILEGGGQSLEAWYFGPRVAYVRVEGFEIRNLQAHGFDTYGGGVHDLFIAGNHVHHIGRNCTDTSNGRTGASLGSQTRRVVLDANVWHDIGRFAPGEGGCAPRTGYYQNHDHGIYVADADEVTIKNNVFYNFSRGWAIHRYSSAGSVSNGLTIINNTFAGRNPYRPGQIILATPTVGLTIENNIFHSPQSAALYFENLRFPGGSVRHNMVYGGSLKTGRPRGVTFSRNWEGTDPRTVGGTDFRLQADSPAIDAGLPLAGVTHDADGVLRPRGRGHDLGAFER
jgi:hypothetical protein